MNHLVPLGVALPMLVAALLVAFSAWIPRLIADLCAISTTAAVLTMTAILARESVHHRIVYWFGGWFPVHGFTLGIPFVCDPFGGGLATLVAALVLAALVFSWRYFDAVGTLFQPLMLIFLAAMVAFSLTGDLFNLFVFFELMSVVAYALTGSKIEEESALEGAINFAVTNSIAAFFILLGVALLYARTGVLDLAEMGRALADHPADGLVICSLTFVMMGFLVKAAIVPFHLWLADAHAVAPTPVCVLFSGVMVELGLYAAARVYWTIFAGVPGLAEALRPILLAFGLVTAVLGAIMCLLQRHLKRLLAFSTISHMGVMLSGVAAFSVVGLTGAAIYLIGHGLVKAALFLCAGIILHESGSVDELELLPKRVGSPSLIIVYGVSALGLAGLPPFTTASGKSIIESAFNGGTHTAVAVAAFLSSALTGAAVMRAGGRILFGWGRTAGEEAASPSERYTEPETARPRNWIPSVMIAPALALVVAALVAGLSPRLLQETQTGAQLFRDRVGYAAQVLDYATGSITQNLPTPHISWTSGMAATACAIALALFELFGRTLPRKMYDRLDPLVRLLRAFHSGRIGDYVTWLIVGMSAFGLAATLQLL